ncbi:potassium channel family protein [Megalodesulfovibrio paquesii]
MAAKQGLEIGIVGLGKFGSALAERLLEMKVTVIGVDRSESRVTAMRDILEHVYQADATDKSALRQLGFGDLTHVVVSSGHSMEASVLATLNLKELGVPQVWCKAISEEHEKILRKLGADFVVFPEQYVAKQIAHHIAVPGLVHYFPLGSGVALQEVVVDKWAGSTLRDLNLTNRFQLQVVGVKHADEKDYTYIPKADRLLNAGDMLLILGGEHRLERIES